MKFLHLIVACAAAYVCLTAVAQNPPLERKVSGRVVDAATGAPLEGVVVRVAGPGVMFLAAPAPYATFVTGKDGRYLLKVRSAHFSVLKIEFSKTGWGPDPHEVTIGSASAQADISLADLKAAPTYYRALAVKMAKDAATLAMGNPTQLESLLSLPAESKAETFRALQEISPNVYAGVVTADQTFATVKQLRGKFAVNANDMTADLDWRNPGRVVISGSIQTEADKAKLFEGLKAPTGRLLFTDNVKVDKSAPPLNNRWAHQPKLPVPNQWLFDKSGGSKG